MPAQTSILDEIMVDNFAGGGGASTGVELATGRPVAVAINHDPDAILMHKTNHPYTKHYCESVWDINPWEVCTGRRVALAWFSPDCKHFSKAKGGKPVEKKIRGLAWIVLRWAGTVRPRVIIVENVEEFQTWGPVRKGRPVKSKTGETFRKWVTQLVSLGYAVEWRELVAADYGAPTIRKRFFLVARCDGKTIKWPETTHAPAGSAEVEEGTKKPWRAVAEVIDWSLPCPSIFDTKQEVKEKHGVVAVRPLADNTMKRVARGTDKFVIKSGSPFLVSIGYGERSGQLPRVRDIEEPLSTQVSTGKQYLAAPYLTKFQQNSIGQVPGEPIDTIMAGATRFGLITPVMTAIGQTGFSEDRSRTPAAPMNTTVSKAESCLIAPSLIQYHGEQGEREVRGQGIDAPVMTIDAAPRYGLAAASLVKYFGQGIGQEAGEPAHTITTKDREALNIAYMSKFYDGGYQGSGNDPADPLSTVTAWDHNAVVASHVVKFKGDNLGQEDGEPLQTLTASSGQFGEVRTCLVKVQPGTELFRWPQVRQMLNTYCGYHIEDDEVLIIRIGEVPYFIADIGLRMLTPRELYNANGFPPDYIIERDYEGNEYGKSKQVARCGNAVPPPFTEAIVRANLPELCAKKITTMRELDDLIAI